LFQFKLQYRRRAKSYKKQHVLKQPNIRYITDTAYFSFSSYPLKNTSNIISRYTESIFSK